jgi:hypothetical protein
MDDLTELDALVKAWRAYIDANQAPGDLNRAAGFQSGLRVCAEQLAETLDRMRADAE